MQTVWPSSIIAWVNSPAPSAGTRLPARARIRARPPGSGSAIPNRRATIRSTFASTATAFLPKAIAALQEHGVTVYGDEDVRALGEGVEAATDEEYAAEFLDLRISGRVVDSLDDAIEHVERYGTRHTEAIVTEDADAARRFTDAVDAAAVMVNASTRFTDGGEFGFGAEIGISTQKLHARGPMGLQELTTTKYIVEGDGQVRS